MKTETEIRKACPYCGQVWCVESEDERPEMLCRCPGALTFQEREENTATMLQSLEMMFGERCGEMEPAFTPVTEEIYALLAEIVDKVGNLMILFKVGRLATAERISRDTYVDIAGYAACAGGMIE